MTEREWAQWQASIVRDFAKQQGTTEYEAFLRVQALIIHDGHQRFPGLWAPEVMVHFELVSGAKPAPESEADLLAYIACAEDGLRSLQTTAEALRQARAAELKHKP